ncbi:archaeosortase A [Natronococcus sp.]|uniref:archaeosortase A n=1 Tax=Natronococcus sp. TaxID=35747 RepID=UPI003A4DF766
MSSPSAPSVDALGALASGETLASTLQGTLPIDALAWIAIAAFGIALLARWSDVAVPARRIAGVAWLLFGTYWLTMVPYYYYDAQSPLQTVLALAALPLCAYTGYLLWNGRESLFVLTKAVALMGLIYLPAETIPIVRQWLIETTAVQTHYGMELLGHSPGLNEGTNGYESRFNFDSEETATGRTTYIVLACTGLGSMAIFGGLIAAVAAPLRRKLAAFALAIGVIWLLNLVRNVFIGLATPHGWFQQDLVVSLVTTYMGAEETRVSYLVAHNYISQLLSVVALIGITYLVVKILPEILEPLEEVLFVLTGTEYDLETALGADVRTDGGSRDR